MNSFITLIKANMFENFTMFKLKSKKQMKITEKILPVAITGLCFLLNTILASVIIEPLHNENLDVVLLTLFVLYTSAMTVIEGIYKSSGLLFNCKDDNLLLSFPIKKSTILLVRIFKFYMFEVLYNSLFLIPAMAVYAYYALPGIAYYVVSALALLLLPIIPVLLSSIVGGAISVYSSRFRFKSFAEIVVTTGSLLLILYISMNFNTVLSDIAQMANNINDTVTKLYYPAGGYIKLVSSFNIIDFITYILINVGLLLAIVFVFSRVYFKINSKIKVIKTGAKNKNYKIKTSKPIASLIKKELNRFINSPVYVTNSGFGLVLFAIGCYAISMKYKDVSGLLVTENIAISIEQIVEYMPVILFGFICVTAFMTSITSSMISLEGKSFNILKSFPVKPVKVILSKIYAALVIIIPFIILGDLIVTIKFNFNGFQTLVILATSVVLPFIAETIGIVVNLKYPRLDAENDTQVIKQSASSMIAVFIGMLLSAITIFVLYVCVTNNINSNVITLWGLIIYAIIAVLLLVYVKKQSVKDFKKLNS